MVRLMAGYCQECSSQSTHYRPPDLGDPYQLVVGHTVISSEQPENFNSTSMIQVISREKVSSYSGRLGKCFDFSRLTVPLKVKWVAVLPTEVKLTLV